MVREFTSESLVVLPKFNVDSGLAMWQALRAGVAAEKKLPKFLQQAWLRVEVTGEALFQAAQTRLTDSSTRASPADKRKADIVVDNAMGAIDDYLAVWMRLSPAEPEAQVAAATRQRLFPDGTGFLKLPFEQEWAQIDRRVAMMKSEGLDKEIANLGGVKFVNQLLAAHAEYGKVLGLTSVPALPPETVTLREPLDALSSALRLFVIKVTAYRDEEEPATLELADRLLRPLVNWVSKAPKASGESEPAPAEPATPQDGKTKSS